MLPGLEALQRLRGVHLRRRRKNHRVEPRKFQGLGEIGRDVADAIFRRGLLGLVELAADERDRLDPVDRLDRVEVLQAEGAGAGKRDFQCLGHAKPRLYCLVIPDDREADDRESSLATGAASWIPGQVCGLPGMTKMQSATPRSPE